MVLCRAAKWTDSVPLSCSKPIVAWWSAGLFCGLKLSMFGPTFDALPFGSHSQKYVPTKEELWDCVHASKKA